MTRENFIRFAKRLKEAGKSFTNIVDYSCEDYMSFSIKEIKIGDICTIRDGRKRVVLDIEPCFGELKKSKRLSLEMDGMIGLFMKLTDMLVAFFQKVLKILFLLKLLQRKSL